MTDEYQVIQISRTKTELDGSEWFEGQDDGGSFKAQLGTLALLGLERVDHTADDSLAAGDMGKIHTNIGAADDSAGVTAAPALVGTGLILYSDGQHRMAMTPNGTDTISDAAAGKQIVLVSRGIVSVDCINTAGNFDVTNATAIFLREL